MKKDKEKFTKINDPVQDFSGAKKELLKLRVAASLADPSVKVHNFKALRRFCARCLTVKNRVNIG